MYPATPGGKRHAELLAEFRTRAAVFQPVYGGFHVTPGVSLLVPLNGMCTGEDGFQMVRVATRPVAAGVMHFMVIGERAIFPFPYVNVIHTEPPLYTLPEIAILIKFVRDENNTSCFPVLFENKRFVCHILLRAWFRIAPKGFP